MLGRILVGIIGSAIGFLIMRNRRKIVDAGIRFNWAESLGMGSYGAIEIIGLIVMIASVFYMFRIGDVFIKPFFDAASQMLNSASRL
jgi:hypothetical protein